MATKKIMAWSKCQIDIGLTEDGLMAETLTNVGTIKDKSSSLEPSDGDALEAIATGGETVAKEVQEGGFTLTTRIIEPTTDLLTLLGISEDGLSVTTHIVDGDWSVQVTPKNKGAYGLKAPKSLDCLQTRMERGGR